MNFFYEFLGTSLEYFGLKKFYPEGFENTHKTSDGTSDFQIVDGFNIVECESFLLISDDKLFSDQKIYISHPEDKECRNKDINELNSINLDYKCSNKKKTIQFRGLKLNNQSESLIAKAATAKLEKTDNIDVLINDKYDEDKSNPTLKFSNGENPGNLCMTPRVKDKKPFQIYKNEKMYFTPEKYKLENKIILGKDFSKSEILLLLRIERKKLALLEGQLRKDLDSLEKSKYDKPSKVIDESIINKLIIPKKSLKVWKKT
ncbi:hypothetical protein FG379_001724 [Cryptosporidium bovis]|uniref:uncharacterized protein n=1 Tax=Cryptosporidium bovis TaxID=310047 RepID=UPI003519F936|nr:hypothetical protein FG379_001724 [Cryptosporidium bovis]